MGAQIKNQDYNDQVKQEGKNKKNDKKPHSEKQPTQVHWECTMGAQIKNQDYNDQVKQEGKNKKNDKKPHSNQGECVE